MAAKKAGRLHLLWPSESIIAGLAMFEHGDKHRSIQHLLHGVLNNPRAASMLAGIGCATKPEGCFEVRDHNSGVDMIKNLHGFLRKPRLSRKFLRELLREESVQELQEALRDTRERWSKERSEDRTDFDVIRKMESWPFAQEKARELAGQLGLAG